MSDAKKTNTQNEIGIIGAGIAGLSCAIALSRLDCNITLIEKNTELKELGAGIQLSPNATTVLAQWNVLEAVESRAFKPTGVRFGHWKTGKKIGDFPLNHKPGKSPYLHIHRADLYQTLLDEVRQKQNVSIQIGEELLNIEQDNASCTAHSIDADGKNKSYQFDFLIGADGLHSICKDYISLDSKAKFTKNIAWRGLITKDKLPFEIEPRANLVMAPDSHFVFYFVGNGEFLNYVAIKENNEFKEEAWTLKGEIDDLLKDFSHFHKSYQQILEQSEEDKLFKWALYDRDPLPAWSKNNILIVGDAAHPVLPFLAQGAAMGIEDAAVLALCFEHFEDKEITDKFYKLRIDRCTRVLEASRDNRALYHETGLIRREVRDIGTRIFSLVYPEFLNSKLDWLYENQLAEFD